jgi:hypothetical protein
MRSNCTWYPGGHRSAEPIHAAGDAVPDLRPPRGGVSRTAGSGGRPRPGRRGTPRRRARRPPVELEPDAALQQLGRAADLDGVWMVDRVAGDGPGDPETTWPIGPAVHHRAGSSRRTQTRCAIGPAGPRSRSIPHRGRERERGPGVGRKRICRSGIRRRPGAGARGAAGAGRLAGQPPARSPIPVMTASGRAFQSLRIAHLTFQTPGFGGQHDSASPFQNSGSMK